MGAVKIQCRAVLFDLDGVLVDSTPAVARVWTSWALEHGFDPESVVRMAHGRTSIATIRELLPDSGQAAHVEEDRDVERREIEDIVDIVPLPGVRELLQSLSADRWAVVTSGTRPLAEVRIRAAGLPLPKYLVTASDITHSKPHPEPYLLGAKSVGVAPRDCVVIEDAPSGIRSGKSAGARVLALRTTAPEPELVNAGADWIVENCASLSAGQDKSSGNLLLQLQAL